jgi:hypothetical protein
VREGRSVGVVFGSGVGFGAEKIQRELGWRPPELCRCSIQREALFPA